MWLPLKENMHLLQPGCVTRNNSNARTRIFIMKGYDYDGARVQYCFNEVEEGDTVAKPASRVLRDTRQQIMATRGWMYIWSESPVKCPKSWKGGPVCG